MGSPLAVLDLGSNSTRFLLFDRQPEASIPRRIRDRGLQVTRVSEGMEEAGQPRLQEQSVRRLMDCLEEFDRRIRKQEGTWWAGVATSAFRRACNGDQILREIQSLLNLDQLRIIDGHREAELTSAGARRSLQGEVVGGTVMDIGGSSTELSATEPGGNPVSLPTGVVRVFESAGTPSGWDEEAHGEMIDTVRSVLGSKAPPGDVLEPPLIVVGGTGTTFAAMQRDLEEYLPDEVHGYRSTRDVVESFLTDQRGRTFESVRDRWPVVHPGREDVLFAGLVILSEVMGWYGWDEFVVSDYGLLVGLMDEVEFFEVD